MITASFKLRAEKETLSLGFRRHSLGPGQSCADVASMGNEVGSCFAVRLVAITDDEVFAISVGATRGRTNRVMRNETPHPGVCPSPVPRLSRRSQ